MLKKKLPLIGVVVLVIALVAVGLYSINETNQKVMLSKQLEELKIEQTRTQAALKSAKQEIERLSQKLQEAEARVKNLTENLSNEQLVTREALSQLDGLRDELEKQVYQKMDMERELNKAKEQMSAMQEKLQKLELIRSDLEAKIKDLEAKNTPARSAVELGQIVVSSPAGSGAVQSEKIEANSASATTKPESLSGAVLVINKEYNFAVINLGMRDGLKIGDTLSVFQKGKFLGDVKIEKIQEAMSAVNFLSPKLKSKLVLGDYDFKVK